MLRFYNLAGIGQSHLHTYPSMSQTYTVLTTWQVTGGRRFHYMVMAQVSVVGK